MVDERRIFLYDTSDVYFSSMRLTALEPSKKKLGTEFSGTQTHLCGGRLRLTEQIGQEKVALIHKKVNGL